MLDMPSASSSFVKNPFRANKPFRRRGFCLGGLWSLRVHRANPHWRFAMSRCNLSFVAALLVACVHGYGQQPLSPKVCEHKWKEAQKLETVVKFARYSGVADFIDAVKASDLGKALAECPEDADLAWKSILKTVDKTSGDGPTFEVDLRTALLLVVFTEHMSPDQVHNLKEFVARRPWKLGFSFASSIAIDALLARKKDPAQDTLYHSYTPDQMEAAVRKYVQK